MFIGLQGWSRWQDALAAVLQSIATAHRGISEVTPIFSFLTRQKGGPIAYTPLFQAITDDFFCLQRKEFCGLRAVSTALRGFLAPGEANLANGSGWACRQKCRTSFIYVELCFYRVITSLQLLIFAGHFVPFGVCLSCSRSIQWLRSYLSNIALGSSSQKE